MCNWEWTPSYKRKHINGSGGFIVWVVSAWHQKPRAVIGQFSQQTLIPLGDLWVGGHRWERMREHPLIVSYSMLFKLGNLAFFTFSFLFWKIFNL